MKRSRILMALGLILILGAAGLTGYNLHTARQAGQAASAALEQLRVAVPRQEQNVHSPVTSVEGEEGDLLMLEKGLEIPDHLLNPKMDMPETVIDGTAYIGYIQIPALGLELPIVSQESAANLQKGPCRYSGSAYQNNLVLAGHNYLQHFGYIRNLTSGDVIRVVDMDGNVFTYEVVDLEMIPADGVEEMLSGDWDLTLFTCNTSKGSRVTIRCDRVAQ